MAASCRWGSKSKKRGGAKGAGISVSQGTRALAHNTEGLRVETGEARGRRPRQAETDADRPLLSGVLQQATGDVCKAVAQVLGAYRDPTPERMEREATALAVALNARDDGLTGHGILDALGEEGVRAVKAEQAALAARAATGEGRGRRHFDPLRRQWIGVPDEA